VWPYDDVELVALLATDLDRAKAFVASHLDGLLGRTPQADDLRRTLKAYPGRPRQPCRGRAAAAPGPQYRHGADSEGRRVSSARFDRRHDGPARGAAARRSLRGRNPPRMTPGGSGLGRTCGHAGAAEIPTGRCARSSMPRLRMTPTQPRPLCAVRSQARQGQSRDPSLTRLPNA
jgi:hypothetical protein